MAVESIPTLLTRLGLSKYAALLEEEAIGDVALLESMGKETMEESMEEIGMDVKDAAKLSAAIFGGGDDDDDDGVQLESNDEGDAPREVSTSVISALASRLMGPASPEGRIS